MDGSLEALLQVDPAALSRDGRLDHLEALHALSARVSAAQEKTLAAIHDPDSQKRWIREEVGAALCWAGDYAEARLSQAAHLTGKMPRLFALHQAGRVSAAHLHAAADATFLLPDEVIDKIDAHVVQRVETQTLGSFRAALRRAVARQDPRRFEQRHAEAVASEKCVRLRTLPNGMAGLWSVHDAVTAEAIFARLTDYANSQVIQRAGVSAGPRTAETAPLDGRRADALAGLVLGTDADAMPARRALVQLLVPATVADTSVADTASDAPCDAPGELVGHGPVPASLCRAVLAEPSTKVERLRLDSAGRVIAEPGIDARPHRYEPSAAQRRHVRAQWRTCRFPGCNRRATRCEVDHLVPFDGHNTAVENLQPLCPRHHHLKHETDWQVRRDQTGTTHWRSPSGRRYAKPPDELPGDDPPPRSD